MASTERSRLHDLLGIWLAILVVFSAVPFGGNIPSFWGLMAVLLGLTAVAYAVVMSGMRRAPPLSTWRIWYVALPWAVFCCYAIVQVLPIGSIVPAVISPTTGAQIVAQTISFAPGQTLLTAAQLVTYGLLFYLLMQAGVRSGRGDLILLILFWSIVAVAMFGLLELTQWGDTLLGTPKAAYFGSATGTFVNRNTFATFLAIGLSLGASKLAASSQIHTLAAGSGTRGLLLLLPTVAGMGVVLATLLATQSRMGLVAGLVGLGVIALFWALKQRQLAILTIGGLTFLSCIVAVYVLYGQGVTDRLGSVESSADVRGQLYQQVLQLISLRPWLGFGGGAFELAFPLVHQPPVSVDLAWDKAHSTYLALWSEFGVLAGTLPVIVVLLTWLSLTISYFRRSPSSAPVLAGIGAIAVVAVHSLVDFSLEVTGVATLLTAVIAIGTGGATTRGTERPPLKERQSRSSL